MCTILVTRKSNNKRTPVFTNLLPLCHADIFLLYGEPMKTTTYYFFQRLVAKIYGFFRRACVLYTL